MDVTDVTTPTGPAGDFDAFFNAEYPKLVRLMFALTGERMEAEDLAQEAMTRMLERWRHVSSMASPAGYAYRVAVNLNRSRLRRLRTRRLREPPTASPAGPQPEIAGSLVAALATLPRGQREALLLVEWLGLDAREAGRILGLSASSVRSRLYRAKATLQAEQGDDGDV